MTLHPGTILDKTERAKWREIDGRVIILDVQTGSYFTLNNVGSFLWSLFDGHRTLDMIADKVCGRFEVNCEKAMEDLDKFADYLVSEHILCLKE